LLVLKPYILKEHCTRLISIVNGVVLRHLAKNMLLLISAHLFQEAGICTVILSFTLSLIISNLMTMRVVKHWSRLPRELVEAPSLETSKARLEGALSNVMQLKMFLVTAGGLG